MGKEGEVIDQQESWRDTTRPVVQRIVFVSGGMGGIGSAICKRLGQTGHTVVAGCLPGYEKKDEWLGSMRAAGYRVHAAEGDVAALGLVVGLSDSDDSSGDHDRPSRMQTRFCWSAWPAVAWASTRSRPRSRT